MTIYWSDVLYYRANKDKYNNSVHLIRNKNHQEKLKDVERYVYFDLF